MNFSQGHKRHILTHFKITEQLVVEVPLEV